MRTTIHSPATGTVVLEGEVTWANAPVVRHVLLAAVTRPQVRHLLVDLAGVTFCDSTGLSALVATHRYYTGLGGSLRLAAPGAFCTAFWTW